MIYYPYTLLYISTSMPYYRRRTGRKFKVYKRRTLRSSYRPRKGGYKSYYKGADVTHFV